MQAVSDVILRPIISEKSFDEAKIGHFTFKVDKAANKRDIAHAIEKLFDVKVIKVATNNVKEKKTTFTKKGRIVRDLGYKKARVTLAKGQKIDIFDEKAK